MTISPEQQTVVDEVAENLRDFLATRTKTSWEPDVDLFASGGMSSLFALELVVYLENTFGIEIGGDDLKLENFRTVRAMTALVQRLRETGE